MTTATNISRLTPELEQIRFDALRYCDERGLEGLDALERVMGALAQQAFLKNIEPYTKAMADVMACGTGTVLQHADGTIEYIPQPVEPSLQSAFDDLIENERRRYDPAGTRLISG